jgi:hypothetical protein
MLLSAVRITVSTRAYFQSTTTVDSKSRSCFVLAPHRRFNNHYSVSSPLIHNLSHYCSLLFERPKSKSEIWKVDLPTVVKVRFKNTLYLRVRLPYIHTRAGEFHSSKKWAIFRFPSEVFTLLLVFIEADLSSRWVHNGVINGGKYVVGAGRGGFRSCQNYNTQVVGVKRAHLIHSSAIIDGADPTVFQTHRQLQRP